MPLTLVSPVWMVGYGEASKNIWQIIFLQTFYVYVISVIFVLDRF